MATNPADNGTNYSSMFGVSVDDFGINSAAIQKAINAAVASNKCTVYFSKKDYTLDASLKLPSNIRLVGYGTRLIGIKNINILGDMSAESANIYEQNEHGGTIIKIEKGLMLAPGDHVILRGSIDEMSGDIAATVDQSQWTSSESEKVRQQELHTVVSVTPYPDYELIEFDNEVMQIYAIGPSYIEKPTITKVASLIENIEISGITFAGIDVFMRVAKNISFLNCGWEIYNDRSGRVDWDKYASTNHGAVSDITFTDCNFYADYVNVSDRKALLCLNGVSRGNFQNVRFEGCYREGLKLVGGVSDTNIERLRCIKIGRRSISLVKAARVTIRNVNFHNGPFAFPLAANYETLLLDHAYNVQIENCRFTAIRGQDCIELRKFAQNITIQNCYFAIAPGSEDSSNERRAINVHAFDETTPYANGKAQNIKICNNIAFLPKEATINDQFTIIRFDDPCDGLLFSGNTTHAEDPMTGRMNASFSVGNAGGKDCSNWKIIENTFNRGCGQVIVRQDLNSPNRKIIGLIWANNTVSSGSTIHGKDFEIHDVNIGTISGSYFMTANATSSKVLIGDNNSRLKESANFYATTPNVPNPAVFSQI